MCWPIKIFTFGAALLPYVVFGQNAAEPAFSVASVKPVPLGPTTYEANPGRIRYRGGIFNLIQRAYQLPSYQIDRTNAILRDAQQYEILAKLPEGSRMADVPAMLRSLLKDRFHFVAHFQDTPMLVYAVTADAAGLKLKVHQKAADPSAEEPVRKLTAPGRGLVTFNGLATIAELAMFLSSAMDQPVLDQTKVTETFDISLQARLPPREIDVSMLPIFRNGNKDRTDADDQSDLRAFGYVIRGDSPDIQVALSRMGLRLEKSRELVRILRVDSVSKDPTEN